MSERNGDKSRFGRLRRQKILRRKQSRELRKVLETQRQMADGQATTKQAYFVGGRLPAFAAKPPAYRPHPDC